MTCKDEATRIDVMICNVAAWSAIRSFNYEFDLEVPSHIGLGATFNIPTFASEALYLRVPRALPVPEDIDYVEKAEIWESLGNKNDQVNKIREFTEKGKTSEAFELLSDLGGGSTISSTRPSGEGGTQGY